MPDEVFNDPAGRPNNLVQVGESEADEYAEEKKSSRRSSKKAEGEAAESSESDESK